MKNHTILIADRNRNVREYLRREIMAEGYRVRLAKTAQEILEWIYDDEIIDLLILDPEIPDVWEVCLFDKIRNRVPSLPLIIHSLYFDDAGQKDMPAEWSFVEKAGKSIENLKNQIRSSLET